MDLNMETKFDFISTTLLRDSSGFGFSVAGGRSGPPFVEGSNVCIYFLKFCSNLLLINFRKFIYHVLLNTDLRTTITR